MFFPLSWNSPPMVSSWAQPGDQIGTGTSRMPVRFWIGERAVGNWWEAEKKVVTCLCNSSGYLWGTNATKEQKRSCWNGNGSWLNRQQCFCWKDSCKGSVWMRGQYYFYRWLLRKTFLPSNVLSLNLVLDHPKVCTNCIAKIDFFNNFSWNQIINSAEAVIKANWIS